MGRLRAALVLNAAFVAVEVLGAIAFSSLALLADAAHMGTDVVALVLALVAAGVARRPASKRHSYGLGRTEVLAALVNGALLVGVTIWVAVEAVRRLGDPQPVEGLGLTLVGVGGLAVNAASAVILLRDESRTLNVRAAALHMVGDAAGSAAAVTAGVAVLVWDARWVDPLASLAICALVVAATWRLLREAVQVLLEGTPFGLDPHEIETEIRRLPGVEGVHHLHVWSLSSGVPALSAHVLAEPRYTLHEAQALAAAVRTLLSDRFGIRHATLEMECHNCETEETPVSLSPPVRRAR